MSEPITAPAQDAGMQLNAVWYQVLKPHPIRNAQGGQALAIVGVTATLQEASAISAQHPGSVIVVSTVIFINQAPAPILRSQ